MLSKLLAEKDDVSTGMTTLEHLRKIRDINGTLEFSSIRGINRTLEFFSPNSLLP